MSNISKSDSNNYYVLIFMQCLSISYAYFILTILVLSIILLTLNVKILIVNLFPTIASIIDSNEFIAASLNYNICSDTNIYSISMLHRLRLSLLCISKEIKRHKFNVISNKNKNYEKQRLTLSDQKGIDNCKLNKFKDYIVGKELLLYTDYKLNNLYDNCRFENVVHYISIFYNRFGLLSSDVHRSISDRLNNTFNEHNLNTEISKRIYIFLNICLHNRESLYSISKKGLIDNEIKILYTFVKDNIL